MSARPGSRDRDWLTWLKHRRYWFGFLNPRNPVADGARITDDGAVRITDDVDTRIID